MTSQIKQIIDSCMDIQKSLGLFNRFEFTHTPLPHPRRLMGQFGAIIGILRCVMHRIGNRFSMRDAVAPQLVRYDLPGLITMYLQ